MDAEALDYIIRGRTTILEILENRGFNVEAYKNITSEALMKMAITNTDLLKIHAKREGVAAGSVEAMDITVIYWVEGAIRLKLEKEIEKLWDPENPDGLNPENDELIILLAEPFHDAFHLQSAKQWTRSKTRISFFSLKNLISNPARHIFVPPHRKLSPDELRSVVSSLHMKSKNEFPHIKYHVDIQARVLGLLPGDVVEIRRPSETAGEYTAYRVCVL